MKRRFFAGVSSKNVLASFQKIEDKISNFKKIKHSNGVSLQLDSIDFFKVSLYCSTIATFLVRQSSSHVYLLFAPSAMSLFVFI